MALCRGSEWCRCGPTKPFTAGDEELRAGRHSGRGFLPAGQKVPGGLFYQVEQERHVRDVFLTCSALVMSS